MKTYTYPKEEWDAVKCAKMANSREVSFGGYKGIIANDSSSYAQYGQTIRFNGGCTREGKWYEAEHRPLPDIPPGWEFVNITSWGTAIQKSKP